MPQPCFPTSFFIVGGNLPRLIERTFGTPDRFVDRLFPLLQCFGDRPPRVAPEYEQDETEDNGCPEEQTGLRI